MVIPGVAEARLAQAEGGFKALPLADETVHSALSHLRRWLTEPTFAAYVPQIEAMIDSGRFDELADAFYRALPFGTGGRRGTVGIGPNRINRWTMRASVQGHIDWLAARSGAPLSVVIAYDTRRFEDLQRRGDPSRPNPVSRLSSRMLAEEAACLYAARGVEAWILPRGSQRLMSTPELSFAIRALGASGGVNFSASHNPPDDNGIKVYDARGGQLIPPEDEALMRAVAAASEGTPWPWERGWASGRIRPIPREIGARYVQTCAGVADPGAPRQIGLRYTPLHGVGQVHRALRAAGFSVEVFAEQATPDPTFSTVPGGVANPERPEVFRRATATAGPEVDLVLATDPDADRIGAACRHRGTWEHLSGQDLALILVDHLLGRWGAPRPGAPRPLVILTEPTSRLVARVARARGAAVVADLLVGFKYIGEVLRALEEEGRWGELRADEVRFVAGLEESHGVLLTDAIRDKDAAGAGVILAEAAATARQQGLTLIDRRDALWHLHGYVIHAQLAGSASGASGRRRLAEQLAALRARPPRTVGGRRVRRFIDHTDPSGRFGPIRSQTDAAARDMLVLELSAGPKDEGARVLLRPSGTEPKLKVYLEVLGRPGLDRAGRDQVDEALAGLSRAMRRNLGFEEIEIRRPAKDLAPQEL